MNKEKNDNINNNVQNQKEQDDKFAEGCAGCFGCPLFAFIIITIIMFVYKAIMWIWKWQV